MFLDANSNDREDVHSTKLCNSSRVCADQDRDAGRYNLVINQSRADDAGKYYCITAEKQYMAELIILESDPVCKFENENNFSDGVLVTVSENSNVHICCEIRFWGNWSPTMEWKLEPGGRVLNASLYEERVQPDHSKTLRSNLDMTINSTQVQTSPFHFSSKIYFGGGNKPDHQCGSTNCPRFVYVWTSPNVSIQSHGPYSMHSIHATNVNPENTPTSIQINSNLIFIGFSAVFIILLVFGVIVGLIVWKMRAISTFERETRDRKTKASSVRRSGNSIWRTQYCEISDRDLQNVERSSIPGSRENTRGHDQGYPEVPYDNHNEGNDEIGAANSRTPGNDSTSQVTVVVHEVSEQSVSSIMPQKDGNYNELDVLTRKTIGPPSIYNGLKNTKSRSAPTLQIPESKIDLDGVDHDDKECFKPKLPTPDSSSQGSMN